MIKAKNTGKNYGSNKTAWVSYLFCFPFLAWVTHAISEMGTCFLQKGQVVCRVPAGSAITSWQVPRSCQENICRKWWSHTGHEHHSCLCVTFLFCTSLCCPVFSLHDEEAGQAFASAATSPARPSSAAAGAASPAAAGQPGGPAPAPRRGPGQGAARAPGGMVSQGRLWHSPAGRLPRRGRRVPQSRTDRRVQRQREARPRQLRAGLREEAQTPRAACRRCQGNGLGVLNFLWFLALTPKRTLLLIWGLGEGC